MACLQERAVWRLPPVCVETSGPLWATGGGEGAFFVCVACAIQHDSAIQRDPTIPCDPVLSDAALSGASPHRTCTTRTSKGLYFAATSGVCLIPSGRLLPDSCPVPAQRPVPFTLPR